MPIDANILFQVGRPTVQLDDPLNKLAQLGQVQGFQNQNALAQIQLDQARRANAQAEGMNKLYQDSIRPDGSLDQGGLITRAAQQGYGSAIPAIQKAFADADKAKADVDKTKAETTKITAESLNTALQQGRDILTQAPNAEVGRRWVISQYNDPNVGQILKKMGTLDQVLAQYDAQTGTPEGFAKWKQGAMLTAEQLIKQTSPDANTVLNAQVSRQNNADTNATSRANNAATNATTQRGQNLSYEAGKVPPGYRRTSDGNLEAIPGGPAEKDKAPTEFQGKSASFGSRAEAADRILTGLEGKGVTNTGIVKGIARGVGNMVPLSDGAVGNALASAVNVLPESLGAPSADQQKTEQARRDFVNAVLRQESGAAIGKGEFDNAEKQYFPQPGDTPEVIRQKQENRRLVIEGFKRNAGSAAKGAFMSGTQASQPSLSGSAKPSLNDIFGQ